MTAADPPPSKPAGSCANSSDSAWPSPSPPAP